MDPGSGTWPQEARLCAPVAALVPDTVPVSVSLPLSPSVSGDLSQAV